MSRFLPPPGTSDIVMSEVSSWLHLEQSARSVFGLYGYGEIRTPIFEYTEVFERGLGDETEVVQKEMYTFNDRGGRSLTLRPEGTAGVMRSLAGTDALNGVEHRVFYMGPMFRGERPAAGRRRQFHQIGVENVGRKDPRLDAECIAMLVHYLKRLGIADANLLINTRGDAADRPKAAEVLKEYFSQYVDSLCEDCKQRLQKNIWRILDCKHPDCQSFIENAPSVVPYFSEASRAYFAEVCHCLDELNVSYQVEPRLVRGLDYYVHTVFELTHHGLGGQNAIAGGGRYEVMVPGSNKPMMGVGFAAGMERLLMVRESLGLEMTACSKTGPVFLIGLGELAFRANWKLSHYLRDDGFAVMFDPEPGKSMKSQMRSADRLGAKIVLIRGESELQTNQVILKNMSDGTQESCEIEQLNAKLHLMLGY